VWVNHFFLRLPVIYTTQSIYFTENGKPLLPALRKMANQKWISPGKTVIDLPKSVTNDFTFAKIRKNILQKIWLPEILFVHSQHNKNK
jgi:hypothetical protein